MAKRKARRRKRTSSSSRKRTSSRAARKPARHAVKAKARRRPAARRAAAPTRTRATAKAKTSRFPRLDRVRKRLDEEPVPSPPSSLNMDRRGTAARTGRAEFEHTRSELKGMSPAITGGDVDVDLENAYFTGDETPGGDNPTPDQDIVDDIGKALGVEYQDNEELKSVDKVTERDRRRWELNPASAEDYRERKP